MKDYLATLRAATAANPIRREITVVPRVLSEQDGTVEYVASDETLDCYREIVRVNGWKFTHFAKNAPFVNSHDYSDIRQQLGVVTDWRIEKGQLVETVKYARIKDTLAEWAFLMVRDGFLKAVSVGFVPTSMCSKWDGDTKDFLSQIGELRLDAATAAQVRVIYREQEQIELSQCIIGANPNALAKSCELIARAYKGGCLDEQAVHSLSAMMAPSKTSDTADDSAGAVKLSLRTKTAVLTEIHRHL
jgi:hypothetical protein